MSTVIDTWKEFLETEPTESDLRDILAKNNKYAGLAAKTLHEKGLLFEKDLTNKDLEYIIVHVEPLQEEAQEMLDKKERRDSLLEKILNS